MSAKKNGELAANVLTAYGWFSIQSSPFLRPRASGMLRLDTEVGVVVLLSLQGWFRCCYLLFDDLKDFIEIIGFKYHRDSLLFCLVKNRTAC